MVFTGGIGENAVFLRQQICAGLTQLGIQLDTKINQTVVAKEAEISTKDSRVKVFVIPANEQVAIANDTYELTSCKLPIVSKQNTDKNATRQRREILQEEGEL